MNNPNRVDFERMMQLAEFGARRHDERRQVEFRIFIAYNTLLVLAFYYFQKMKPWWANIVGNLYVPESILKGLDTWSVPIGLVFIHFVYLLWQIRLSIALVNDASRRNFYLKKAECIFHHFMETPYAAFRPRTDRYVTLSSYNRKDEMKDRYGCKDDVISEYALFKRYEPIIVSVPKMWKIWKDWLQIFKDWSRLFQTVIPTAILLMFITKLDMDLRGPIVTLILIVLLALLGALIESFLIHKRKKQ